MHYVVGFLFRSLGDEVVLIKKARPAYLRDYLNGVGGGVERGEPAAVAMSREFEEEAGTHVPPNEWHPFATLNTTRGDRIDFFAGLWHPSLGTVQTRTPEPVDWYPMTVLGQDQVYPNLRYLVPMARDALFKVTSQFKHLTIIESR